MQRTILFGMALLVLCAGITAVSAQIGGDQGWYLVHCNVDGADVYFDGTYMGTTQNGQLYVPVYSTGTPYQTIRVDKSGYKTYSGTLPGSPAMGETVDVYVTLQPVATYGSIYATSTPSGAAIYLNGNYRGVTPLTISDVSPGTYTIEADKTGYQPYPTTITVTSGQQTNVLFPLTPIAQYGSINVNSNPSGAYLYLDGVYKGRTPLTLNSVQAKSHTIELDLNGYYDWKTTMDVTAGVTSYINAQMQPVPAQTTGYIDVSSSPAGANIFLDGAYQGQTTVTGPFTIANVQAGSHTVKLTMAGYQDYSTSVNVRAATTSYVNAALQPAVAVDTGSISVSSSPTGAGIYIDDAYKGLTPLTVDGVATGSHSVKVTLAGYQDWSTEVQVGAGSTASVSASLSPVPTTAQAGLAPFAAMGALALGAGMLGFRRRT
jgi:hypothetical protein